MGVLPNFECLLNLVDMKIWLLFVCSTISLGIFAQESVLNDGTWYQFTTNKDGVYGLNYEQLNALGILNEPIPSNSIRMFSNGPGMLPEENWMSRPFDLNEVAIEVADNGDGTFGPGDQLLFVGSDQITWKYNSNEEYFEHANNLYEDRTHFFLTLNNGEGERIEPWDGLSLPVTQTTNTFIDFQLHEIDAHNFLSTGKQWVGENFEETSTLSFDFNFPNVDTQIPGKCIVDLFSRSTGTGNHNSFEVIAPGNSSNFEVINVSSNYLNDLFRNARHVTEFTPQSDITTIDLTMNPGTGNTQGWIDFVSITATRALKVTDNEQLLFRQPVGLGQPGATLFRIENATLNHVVWDITSFNGPYRVQSSLNDSLLEFQGNHNILHEYVCFTPEQILTPEFEGMVSNQNLKGQAFAEGFIVTHPDFIAQANQLAQFHEMHSGISVNVATTTQIYNEFSGGKKDITAIRDYLRYFYENAPDPENQPKYLCLFGDASFDYKGFKYPGSDFVPTFQSQKSLALITSYCSDDYFGLLEVDESNELINTVDIAIGRLPAKTAEEAQVMVDKIIAYKSLENFGDWQYNALFVADDEDNNVHMSQSNNLATSMESENCGLHIAKCYIDAYEQTTNDDGLPRFPEARAFIENKLNDGVLLCNYTGHSGFNAWAYEMIMVDTTFAQLENSSRLPLFFMANCEFSKFDNPQHNSGSEILMSNAEGGAIACISNSRPAYSSSNYQFNNNFNNNIFQRFDGKHMTLGELVQSAKNASTSSLGMTHRSMNLLGDPMLRLNHPELSINVTEVSGTTISEDDEAFLPYSSNVNFSGEIVDYEGVPATSFDGELSYLILDSPVPLITLGNDGTTPFQYSARVDTVASGTATVTAGVFSFDAFIANNGNGYNENGKLILFAQSDYTTAVGCYTDFYTTQSPVSVNQHAPLQATFYPNPVQETLRISLESIHNEPVYANLFDETGKLLRQMQFAAGEAIEISMSEMSAGTYILKIRSGPETGAVKVVKVP